MHKIGSTGHDWEGYVTLSVTLLYYHLMFFMLNQSIEVVRKSWTFRHPREIIIMSLFVALVIQVHMAGINAWLEGFTSDTVAQNGTACEMACQQKEWVDKRAREILEQDMAGHIKESQYKALIELNRMSVDVSKLYTGDEGKR